MPLPDITLPKSVWFLLLYLTGIAALSIIAWVLKAAMLLL